MTDENNSQHHVIANQLFNAWEAQRVRRMGKLAGSIPAWIGCVVAVAGGIWAAGVLAADVDDNTRRITAIEIIQREQASDTRAMIERLARIEAKLDVLTEKKQ